MKSFWLLQGSSLLLFINPACRLWLSDLLSTLQPLKQWNTSCFVITFSCLQRVKQSPKNKSCKHEQHCGNIFQVLLNLKDCITWAYYWLPTNLGIWEMGQEEQGQHYCWGRKSISVIAHLVGIYLLPSGDPDEASPILRQCLLYTEYLQDQYYTNHKTTALSHRAFLYNEQCTIFLFFQLLYSNCFKIPETKTFTC